MKGYKRLGEKKDKRKYLGRYLTVKNEGDWERGFEIAVRELSTKFSLEQKEMELRDGLEEFVKENNHIFYGRSRLVLASAVLFLSWMDDEDDRKVKKDAYDKMPCSRSSVRNCIDELKEKYPKDLNTKKY